MFLLSRPRNAGVLVSAAFGACTESIKFIGCEIYKEEK